MTSKALINRSRNVVVAAQVREANTFVTRLIGLMGKTSWPADAAMWFDACDGIHTFFMKFPIDVVFVDQAMKVTRIYRDVPPWRLVWPVFGASAAFEFAAGVASPEKISEGDQLHVGA